MVKEVEESTKHVLVIILSDNTRYQYTEKDDVLSFVSSVDSSVNVSNNMHSSAHWASSEIKNSYPEWLYNTALKTGLLELYTVQGLSWWWLSPVSEKSPFRDVFIEKLYRLGCVLNQIQQLNITAIKLYYSDKAESDMYENMCNKHNLAFESHVSQRSGQSKAGNFVTKTYGLVTQVGNIFYSRILSLLSGENNARNAETVLMFTRYPALWADSGVTERMYGRLPQELDKRKIEYSFISTISCSLITSIKLFPSFFRDTKNNNIVFIERYGKISDALYSFVNIDLWTRFRKWTTSHKDDEITFFGIDIHSLFVKYIQENVYSNELSRNICLQRATARLLNKKGNKTKVLIHPFEYQPMERALYQSVKSFNKDIKIIGIQTGIYTSMQMGFDFPPLEVCDLKSNSNKSVVPDYLVSYGEITQTGFTQRIGLERVFDCGAIRYTGLNINPEKLAEISRKCSVYPGKNDYILVTTGLEKDESIEILHSAFRLAESNKSILLLIKAHYHLPLSNYIQKLSRQYNVPYILFLDDLYELMKLSSYMLCGSTSTCYEAIHFDCMPLVYYSDKKLPTSPALETSDAFVFWSSFDELMESFNKNDKEIERLHENWHKALKMQMYKTDKADIDFSEKLLALL